MSRLAVVFAALSCFAAAQSPKSFDVATIKPYVPSPNALRVGIQLQGERFLDGGAPLSSLIEYAYDIESYQVTGAPEWAGRETYEIQASAGTGTQLTEPLAKEMLRGLLAERFGLRMRKESRELDALRLVTNGAPKLTATDRKSAGFLMSRDGAETKGASMLELTRMIQRFGDRGRPIVDRTGLTGSYEFRLNFQPPRSAAPDGTAPDIVTALKEQLNLRLEPAKERVDVWIVDSVEKPTAN